MNKPTKRWMQKKTDGYVTLFSGTTFSDSKEAVTWIRNAMLMAMRDAVEQTVNMNPVITGKPMKEDKIINLNSKT